MILKDFTKFKGGWLVGNFKESIIQNANYEIGIKKINKGFVDKAHFHRGGNEYNLLIEGSLKNNNEIIKKNIIFIFEKDEIAQVEALEDSTVLVFRDYSDPSDKYVV